MVLPIRALHKKSKSHRRQWVGFGLFGHSRRLGYGRSKLGQSSSSFGGLWCPRKASQNFAPRRAVVVILLCFSIKNKSNALTAITIQPAVVQKVTKRRRQTSTDV